MSEHDDIHLDIDPMMFMQMVVNDHLSLIDDLTGADPMFEVMPGMAEMAEAVAGVGREKVAEAQTHLDMLVAADPTWKPAYGTPCEMVLDGHDTDGTEWNRCTTHGYLVLGDAYVCEGYAPPPYTGKH
jgi:hypothetical protein